MRGEEGGSAMIADNDREKLRLYLEKGMKDDVRLVMFTQEVECEFCRETREIVQLLSSLSGKIKAEVYDFVADAERARELKVDKIPALVPLGKRDYGIRFYGIPSGYEFMSLVDAIIDVSTGTADLSEGTKRAIKAISRPIHIQVFVTPTCPYCQRAVRLAHKLAVENENIRADMVESVEFLQMAQRYGVMAVPKIVMNEKIEFVGALPEEHFVEHLMMAATSMASS
jgi:glutaredoxin-like protein